MIHITHNGPLMPDEKQLISSLTENLEQTAIDEDSNHLPGFVYAGGPGAMVPLAWLAITFIGAGATIVVKKFLEQIGSELGKKLVERFTRKVDETTSKSSLKNPVYPIVVVYEIKPRTTAVIPLVAPNHPGFDKRLQVPSLIEEEVVKLTTQSAVTMLAWFDEKSELWHVSEDRIGAGHPIVWDSEKGVFFFVQ